MVRSIFRVLLGFALACLAAGLVTVLFVTTPSDLAATPTDALPVSLAQSFIWALLTATHSAIFAAAFAIIAIGIAEWIGLNALWYYIAVACGIALLGYSVQYSSEIDGQPTVLNSYAALAFLTSGLASGLVYWATAGRYAGRVGDDEFTDISTREQPSILTRGSPPPIRDGERVEIKKTSSLRHKLSSRQSDEDDPDPQATVGSTAARKRDD